MKAWNDNAITKAFYLVKQYVAECIAKIKPGDIGAAAAAHNHFASDIVAGTLPITRGGTGATTVENARSNLGAAAATHKHSASDIAYGVLPIDAGGTGAITAEGALSNLGAAAASHTHLASDITSGTLPIARGGTGATTAANALSALGGVPQTGATMDGPLVAQSNTSYTTAQMRNVIISTEDPSGGNNGDIWLKYEA